MICIDSFTQEKLAKHEGGKFLMIHENKVVQIFLFHFFFCSIWFQTLNSKKTKRKRQKKIQNVYDSKREATLQKQHFTSSYKTKHTNLSFFSSFSLKYLSLLFLLPSQCRSIQLMLILHLTLSASLSIKIRALFWTNPISQSSYFRAFSAYNFAF